MSEEAEVKYTYPEILEQIRKRLNDAKILYPLMDRMKTELDLESVETCLSMGTGPGEYDIEFTKRCLSNLKRFIAVEQNADCVTQLRSNLQENLPHLDKAIYQESIEEWKGPDCQVDIILLFHMFYNIKREDRLKLMEKFQSWLKPQTGVLVVLHMSDEEEKVHVLRKLYREMEGWAQPLEAEELKKEFLSLGFVVHPEIKYHFTADLRNVDVDMLKIVFPSDEANIRKALGKVAPSGFGTGVSELFAVKSRRECNGNAKLAALTFGRFG